MRLDYQRIGFSIETESQNSEKIVRIDHENSIDDGGMLWDTRVTNNTNHDLFNSRLFIILSRGG